MWGASLGTSSRRRSPSESATGRPCSAEWESLPSTWQSPREASSSIASAASPRSRASAVSWMSAPRPQRAISVSTKFRPGWRSGWAIKLAKPASASASTVLRSDGPSGPGAGSTSSQRPPPPSVIAASSSRSRPAAAVSASSPPVATPSASPCRSSSAFSPATRSGSSAILRSWSWRMWGVAQTSSIPSSSACRAMATLSAGMAAPSSMPGRMWQWRSIKPDAPLCAARRAPSGAAWPTRAASAREATPRCRRRARPGRAPCCGRR
jgi:hypothetical protein